MAKKGVWIGSVGPFIYDDESEYDPVNEPGVYRKGLRTDGAILVGGDMEVEGTTSSTILEGNLQGFNEALKMSFLL